MKQHWKIIGIYAIINILMLAGCKEKRVDYTIEGQTETPRETEQSAGAAGVGQFADAERWKEEIDRLEEFMLQAKEEGNKSSYESFQEQIAECQAKWEQAPDSYQPVETYDVDEYMGYRDGISYELSVQNSEDNGIGERSSRIALMARDMYEVCPKRMEEVSDLTCRVGDTAFFEEENECGFTVELDTSVYSADSYVLVDISKKGIVYLYAENPAVIENISNPVRLLPLDTIKGIVQAQVEQNFDGMKFEEPVRFSNTAYNRMELIYFRMADKKNPGYYSYVPVWRLAITSDTVTKGLDGEKRSVDWVVNEIMVNAMDGSIVTLAEDYFGV